MITLKIQGGLGNQMFQYALAYVLSKKNDDHITFDPFYLENRFIFANWTFRHFELDVFGINKEYSIPNVFFRKYTHPRIIEILRSFQYTSRYIREVGGRFIESFPKDTYLDGWFQSYKYFEAYDENIKKIFEVKTPLSDKNQQIIQEMTENRDKTISLHVRRGDYVSLPTANKWHGICSIDYYEAAIAYIIDSIDAPVFYIFSDDIAWCRENIHFPSDIEIKYIDHNGSAGHEDLRLMYSCGHHIIANSSFSWWGAYLGKNPDKIIIAPKKWLQIDSFSTENLIPSTWTLL